MFEIVLDLERFATRRTRKSWRIENDHVESFASSGEPRQHGSHVIGYEAMVHGWKIVQRKILPSAREILFGQINVEGACTVACSAHGKRAGVSKTVQQVLWCDVTHVTTILSLVQKEARRIACAEV